MNNLRTVLQRLRALFGGGKLDREMDDEMHAHLEHETAQNIARGMAPEEARCAARRAFGGIDRLQEEERDVRGFKWIESVFQDLRYTLRGIRGRPGFATLAVLSLALAIGVNSAVFNMVNALFLRPVIPLRAEEVVNIHTAREGAERTYRAFSFAEYRLLRESTEVFAEVAAFRLASVGIAESESSEMRRKLGYLVSDTYFPTLGVVPAAGRFFLPEESAPNASIPVAVVSHALWERLEGSAPFASQTILINGKQCAIVGVAPRGFGGGNALLASDIWLPLGMASSVSEAFGQGYTGEDLSDPTHFSLYAIARLQPDLSLEDAAHRLPAIAARLSTIAADSAEGTRSLGIQRPSRFNISTEPSSDGPLRLFGVLLLGIAGVVLLVASLNLANLFLARSVARSQELAVRFALGASRWRVVQLLFLEGFVIALAGGACGLVLSNWANTLVLDSLIRSSFLSSFGFSLAWTAAPDLLDLAATLGFCTAATLVFSVGPALRATRKQAQQRLALHGAERAVSARWGGLFSGRQCLLTIQLALSFALLFSAGLFVRAAYRASNLDPGFRLDGGLVAELDFALGGREEAEVRTQVAAVVDMVRALPTVEHVAIASHLPFGGVANSLTVSPLDPPTDGSSRSARGTLTAVSAGYFDAMGVRLLRGRDFTEVEWRGPATPPVVIIDERMAATLFHGEDSVGKRLERKRATDEAASEPMEVIGVVSAHREKVFAEGPPPRLFLPLARRFSPSVFVHVRGHSTDAVSTGILREQVRNRLHTLDAGLPMVQVAPLATIIDGNLELWSVRFVAVLFAIFGMIALFLAVTGVYGVKAFMVARRMREFGIRTALGARPQQLFAMLAKQSAVQIGVGLSAGVLLALGCGQVLAGMLLRVSPHDPLVLVAAALPLAAAAFLAGWLPARRATKVDPMTALRAE